MSDGGTISSDIRALTALLKESQQQSQLRHRDYLDGRQAIQVVQSQLQALESAGTTPQTPRTTSNAAGQKPGSQSSSSKAPQNPQTSSSRTQLQPSAPSKPAAPKPAAGPSAHPAPPQTKRAADIQDVRDADDEGLPAGWEAKNRKRGTRPQATNERNALIRGIVQRFLQYEIEPRPDDRDGKIYSNFPPSPAAGEPLPDSLSEASSIDWGSKLSSPYNHRIIVLLVAEVRRLNRTGFYYGTAEIAEALKEHLRYLRDIRKALFLPVDPNVEEEQRLYHSANTRKNSLSAARLAFILRFHLAQYFHISPQMLEVLLGVDCTSEDELDDSPDSSTYLIRRLRWRNAKLTALLRLVDKCMELRSRRKGGSRARSRIPGLIADSEAHPPEGFPENWFDMDYLDGLDRWDRHALLIGPEVEVDWEHLHSALTAIVRKERARQKKRARAPATA